MTEAQGSKLAALAERLFELRDEKRYLEAEIVKVSDALAQEIGEGTSRTLGRMEVRVTEARTSLKVVDEGAVPATFLTQKPDRKRLLEHVKETGEVPEGVEVSAGRPTVYVRAAGEG